VSVFYFSLPLVSLIRRSQCVGMTPDKQDFAAFIGADKANEFKLLFTNWIYKIYRKRLFAIYLYRCLSVCRFS
jgi:hypothetical protein